MPAQKKTGDGRTKHMKKKYLRTRYPFKVRGVTGVQTMWVPVVRGKASIVLLLTADHVRRSINQCGWGSCGTCPIALCVIDHSKHFKHQVHAMVDVTDRRIYIVSKLDKNGWPIECVAYDHQSEFPQTFDPTKQNERALNSLLKYLDANGSIAIRLHPMTHQPYVPGRKWGGTKGDPDADNEKSRKVSGAHLRAINTERGVVPDTKLARKAKMKVA